MNVISQLLASHRFVELFLEELGWDRSSGTVSIDINDRHFEFEAVAQKRGFQVLQCSADRRVLFNRGLLRRIQRMVSTTVHEHILIYSSDNPPKQVWQWAVRMPDGRKLRHREHPFFSASPPPSLENRLKGLRFSLDEESDVTFVEALHRVRATLDVAPDLKLFAKRPWYAERSDNLAIAMARGDKGAFHEFILLHRPLARHISKRLQRTFGIDANDAENIGVIGLIEAATRFDPERGIQFSTYAYYWVRQACQRYGAHAGLLIRVPRHIIEYVFPVHRHIEQLESEYGPQRANDELGRLCENDPRFLAQWLVAERTLNVRSLSDQNTPEFQEALTLLEVAEYEPIQRELDKERDDRIRNAMSCLNTREQRIVRQRHGIESDPRTLEEIGQQEGITKERVRQIQMVAEKKLRTLVMRGLEDLLPSHFFNIPGPQAEDQECRPDGGRNTETT
jgi:RNA polymerase primary sigma factor